MPTRPASPVDRYRAEGQVPDLSHRGGRGLRGPLSVWLLLEEAAITEAKQSQWPLTWGELAKLAADGGVLRADGTSYTATDLRRAWWSLNRDLTGRRQKQTTAQTVVLPVSTQPVVAQVATQPTDFCSPMLSSRAAAPPRVRHFGDEG
jgi:hypothetical protein